VSLDNPKSYGAQEVIVETPIHGQQLDELSISQVAKLLKVYALRTKEISENKKISYILIFKKVKEPLKGSFTNPPVGGKSLFSIFIDHILRENQKIF